MKSFLPELLFHILIPTESKSKVNNFEVEGMFIEEDYVFEFEIPMTDVLGMKVGDSFDKLKENNFSLRFRHDILFINNRKQVSTFQ